MINLITNTVGINLNTVLHLLGLDFISFGETQLHSKDHYAILYTTPIFNIKNGTLDNWFN